MRWLKIGPSASVDRPVGDWLGRCGLVCARCRADLGACCADRRLSADRGCIELVLSMRIATASGEGCGCFKIPHVVVERCERMGSRHSGLLGPSVLAFCHHCCSVVIVAAIAASKRAIEKLAAVLLALDKIGFVLCNKCEARTAGASRAISDVPGPRHQRRDSRQHAAVTGGHSF